VVLALLSRLGPRLHGGDRRWRRLAADREVAEALAALISGLAPAGPLWRLLRRYPSLRRVPP
jgi:hypothetical protein